MDSMGKKVGNLCRGSSYDNDARSDIQKEEATELEMVEKETSALVTSIGFMGPEIAMNVGKPTFGIIKWDGCNPVWKEDDAESETGCPSKFLMMCLNSIQNALQQNNVCSIEVDRPFFANPWGFEFWICYTNGKDVLEMDGADSKMEKIAWITSSAADTIWMKEKEGLSFKSPFLLYLVPSEDKAYEVNQVCKALQTVGIYTISLRSGDSVDHILHSFKSAEPEFLVSTPEKLLELLTVKAIELSDVSLMVIEGLEAPFEGTYPDAVKSIRKYISRNPQTVIFCDHKSDSVISECK